MKRRAIGDVGCGMRAPACAAAGALLVAALVLAPSALIRGAQASLPEDVAAICREEWGSWEEPVKARARLAEAGAPAARLLLSAWVENETPHARDWVAATLRLMAGRFREKPKSKDAPREAFVEALGPTTGPAPLRGLAAECLGRLGDAAAVPALVAALKEEAVAAPAAAALGALRAREAVQPLIAVSRDGSAEARIAGLRALGQIGDKAAVGFLSEVASMAKGEEAVAAAAALGEIADASAGEALRKLVDSEDAGLRRRVALALMRRDTRLAAGGNLKALLGEPGGGCQGCHAQIAADFATSKHATQLKMKCATCHGASVPHMEEYGKVKPESPLSPGEMPDACGKCHKDFSTSRDVRYDPVAGLDHRFAWSTSLAKRLAQAVLRLPIVPADLPELLRDDFEGEGLERWLLAPPAVWRHSTVEGGKALELLNGRRHPKLSAPGAFALAKGLSVGTFSLSARVRCTAPPGATLRDMAVVFGYQDDDHFYFAHFAGATANGVNMIALVNGKDREPIHLDTKPVARLQDTEWHQVKVERNAETGAIKAYIDDMRTPTFVARDTTLTTGAVGFSSLGDKGFFDDVVILGKRAPQGAATLRPEPPAAAKPPAAVKAPARVDEALLSATPPPLKTLYRGDFGNGRAEGWSPREGNRWEVARDPDGGADGRGAGFFYRLAEAGKQGKIRAPAGYAVLDSPSVSDCVLTVRARCRREPSVQGRDLVLLCGYQDPEHYYYVHFSNHSAGVHNAILKVGDGRPPDPSAPGAARRPAE